MTTADPASGRRVHGRRTPGALDRERGAATVLLLAVVAAALILATAAVALARAADARGTAQAAADLAAIAAAQAAQRPGGGPCAVAARVVGANGAALSACSVEAGGDVEVVVTVAVEPLTGWHTAAIAVARAGPVR